MPSSGEPVLVPCTVPHSLSAPRGSLPGGGYFLRLHPVDGVSKFPDGTQALGSRRFRQRPRRTRGQQGQRVAFTDCVLGDEQGSQATRPLVLLRQAADIQDQVNPSELSVTRNQISSAPRRSPSRSISILPAISSRGRKATTFHPGRAGAASTNCLAASTSSDCRPR